MGLDHRKHRRLILVWLLCVLVAAVAGYAEADTIPQWLERGAESPGSAPTGPDPSKRVWLVLGSADDHPLADAIVQPMPVFIQEQSGRRFPHDLRFTITHEGHTFAFDRRDIAYIRLYTRMTFQADDGPPTRYSYRPAIQLKNGDLITDIPATLTPAGALQPETYRYETVEVTTLHGKRSERTTTAPLARPVLALAWTRAEAEEALEQTLLRFARNEYNRLLIPYNQEMTAYTPAGPVTVKPRASYQEQTGYYNGPLRITRGTLAVTIHGKTKPGISNPGAPPPTGRNAVPSPA